MQTPSVLRRRKGFTLIELLIVITIIGILAVALVPRITQGPARARDTKRKADLQNIAAALELYYADNQTYPIPADASLCLNTNADLLSALKPYLQGGTLPQEPGAGDPIDSGCSGSYYYKALDVVGTTAPAYVLAADLEVDIAGSAEGIYCLTSTDDDDWDTIATVSSDLANATCTGTALDTQFVMAR